MILTIKKWSLEIEVVCLTMRLSSILGNRYLLSDKQGSLLWLSGCVLKLTLELSNNCIGETGEVLSHMCALGIRTPYPLLTVQAHQCHWEMGLTHVVAYHCACHGHHQIVWVPILRLGAEAWTRIGNWTFGMPVSQIPSSDMGYTTLAASDGLGGWTVWHLDTEPFLTSSKAGSSFFGFLVVGVLSLGLTINTAIS